MKKRNIISILLVLTIIFTITGGSLAYYNWQTSVSQQTKVTFTVEKGFSCSADGGGNITSVSLVPSSCNSDYAIKKAIKVMPQITGNKTIYMDLWLDVNEMGSGLVNSNNLKYVLSTSSISCETGIVSSGNLRGKTVSLLSSKEYTQTKTDTYYLYIWLDKAETSTDTQNQKLSLSLNGSCDDESTLNGADPELDDGMIPVVIDNSGSETTIKTVKRNDPSWYNYENKLWSNVVLTTNDSRSKYLNTSDVSVSEDDILAYYVWIPRYKYKIWTTTRSSTRQEQTIDIAFEDKNSSKSTGTTVGSYRTHPAFTFGDTELNGIWVGKFETTGNATTPMIKPNMVSLINQSINTQFSTSKKFGTSTYGSTSKIDAHMMKNSEWGATTYLSYSAYGINNEMYINNSEKYYTGRSAGVDPIKWTGTLGTYTWDGKDTYSGNYASDRTLSTKASTTGNVTGIYDMSGGTIENVMGNYNKKVRFSGFGIMPDSKYYDNYTTGDSLTACNGEICYGHALSETYYWYGYYNFFLNTDDSWITRGSSYMAKKIQVYLMEIFQQERQQ